MSTPAVVASLNARFRTPDGGLFTATFALMADGTVTCQVTEVDGMPMNSTPAPYRLLDEDRRRRYCADADAARQYLTGLVTAQGWTVP